MSLNIVEQLFVPTAKNEEINILYTKRQDFLDKYKMDNSLFDPVKKPGVAVDRYVLRNRKADESAKCPYELIFKAITIKKVQEEAKFIENEIQANAFLQNQQNKPNYFLQYYGWAIVESLHTYTYYIFLELCSEGSLFSVLNKDLSVDQVFKYFIQITDALLYLKSLGFAHRDLKLQNILVKQNIIKLMDFGLTKKVNYELNLDQSNLNSVMIGTESYLAPEQIYYMNTSKKNEEKIDPYACDIYSFGLIMINLLRGKPLYYEAQRKKPDFQNSNPEEQLYGTDEQAGDAYIMKKLNKTIEKRITNDQKSNYLLTTFKKLIVQMLIYNPKRRIDLIDLKISLIKKLSQLNDLKVEEKKMCLEKYGLYTLLQEQFQNLKEQIKKLENQAKSQPQQTKQQNLLSSKKNLTQSQPKQTKHQQKVSPSKANVSKTLNKPKQQIKIQKVGQPTIIQKQLDNQANKQCQTMIAKNITINKASDLKSMLEQIQIKKTMFIVSTDLIDISKLMEELKLDICQKQLIGQCIQELKIDYNKTSGEISENIILPYTSLKSLDLNFYQIDDRIMNIFCQALQKLHTLTSINLDLSYNIKCTEQSLSSLSQSLKHLTELINIHFNFDNNEVFTDAILCSLSEALKELQNLKNISFNCQSNTNITDTALIELSQAFQKLPKLKNIYLSFQSNKNFTDIGINHLSESFNQLTQLTNLHLDFGHNKNFTDIALNNLCNSFQKSSQLTNIHLSFWHNENFGDTGIKTFSESLQKLPQITDLYLGFCENKNFTDMEMIKLMKSFAKLTQLQSLELIFKQNLNFTDAILINLSQTFSNLPQLNKLNLVFLYNKNFTDIGMNNLSQSLEKLSQLTHLYLGFYQNKNFTDLAMNNLSQAIQKLPVLNIFRCFFNNQRFFSLKDFLNKY